uniref:Uncharacterized protein n=1 Tax=Rhizophora mucronata TaxID=61149 RepID=A0A2P2JAE7_RHIMU
MHFLQCLLGFLGRCTSACMFC